jgi:hypothetical protein
MIDLNQNIVHRRPRPDAMSGAEWAIVFLPHNDNHKFVVCTLTPDTLKHSEWVHGTYHETYAGAKRDYDDRPAPPSGPEAWRAAGIPDADIEEWFRAKIEEIGECAKDLAHEQASSMTAADFRDEMDIMEDDGQPSAAWRMLAAANNELAEQLIEKFRLGSELMDLTAENILTMLQPEGGDGGEAYMTSNAFDR